MSLREQALAVIRHALITGDIASGEIYFSNLSGNSAWHITGPVREAMLALVSEGIIEPVPNRRFSRSSPL